MWYGASGRHLESVSLDLCPLLLRSTVVVGRNLVTEDLPYFFKCPLFCFRKQEVNACDIYS